MYPDFIVFLGPSLPIGEAQTILPADFRPPVRAGDLEALPNDSTIGVIDGVLEPSLAIGRDEICRALNTGAEIYGSASTGALLATWIFHPRLHGLGRVYDFLRHVPHAAEDLISVLYAEHDATPLTEPLINAAITFTDAASVHGTASPQSRDLITILRSIPLPDRSLDNVSAVTRAFCRKAGIPDLTIKDHKAADARLLLEYLATLRR